MFMTRACRSMEYYLNAADQNQKQAGRNFAAYYFDTTHGEPPGVIFTPKLGPDSKVKFRFAENGTIARPTDVRDWGAGIDPATGLAMVRQSKSRMACYDCTVAPPKPVSVLWACGTPEIRHAVETAQTRAVNEVAQWLHDNGFVITRTGKGGETKVPVQDWVAVNFRHHLNREGNPFLHDHFDIMNIAACDDGRMRCLDNSRMRNAQIAIANVFRVSLAHALPEELDKVGMKISIQQHEKENKGFIIEGIPDEIIDNVWTDREDAIKAWLEENTGDRSTVGRKGAVQVASHASRPDKKSVPPISELDAKGGRWDQDLGAVGCTREGVCESIRQAAMRAEFREQRLADEGRMTVEQLRAEIRREAADRAIDKLDLTMATYEEKHVLRHVFENLQGKGSIEDAQAEIRRLVATDRIRHIGFTENGEKVYCDPEFAETERKMILDCSERKDEREWASDELVQKCIDDFNSRQPPDRQLTGEQCDAIRWSTNRDGVSVVQGKAGTGKTSMLVVAKAAFDWMGNDTHAIAPSHKAREGLVSGLKLRQEASAAVSGFVAKLEKGTVKLGKNSVVIVDEAGMVDTVPMARLAHHARLAGAKLVLVGDVYQIPPVGAGAALKAIAREISSSDILKIQRQQGLGGEDKEWRCAASCRFSVGQGDLALEDYDIRGLIRWNMDGRDATIAELAADLKADLLAYPDRTRAVIAARNSDVRDLNGVLRCVYQDVGLITGPDTIVQAIPRGTNATVVPLKLAIGERLIFGESIPEMGIEGGGKKYLDAKTRKLMVTNSDFGTLTKISDSGEKGNPHVEIKLDKGTVVSCKWNELQGYRGPKSKKEDCHPKVQSALSITTHASQGSGYDDTYLFNGHGMGMESIYVGMTRYYLNAKLYIDGQRVVHSLEEKQNSALDARISDKGQLELPDIDDPIENGKEFGVEDVKKTVKKEALKSDGKSNCSDFCISRKDWLDGREVLGPKERIVASTVDDAKSEEKWFYREGGLDALSAADRTFATDAHRKWREANPERNVHSLSSYIDYVQKKHADNGTAELPYDDTRLWTDKPGPWCPHVAGLPEIGPLTPEELRTHMCGRVADMSGFSLGAKPTVSVPNLTALPLPPAIADLADRHRATLAAADTTIETPDHDRDQAPAPSLKPSKSDAATPAADPDPDAADRAAERREREQAERERHAAAEARRREMERQRQMEASRGFGM